MAVHHQFTEAQHLSAQVEGIPKPGLLSLLEDNNKATNQNWCNQKQRKLLCGLK